MKFSISLLISTYNRKETLRLALESAFRQTVLPSEILIADDGSREDTRQMIEEMRAVSPVPLVHVWHEDDGFRVGVIRNKALAKASGDYIIQIDGDIVIHPHFVADHVEMAEKGCFVCGSRVSLSPEATDKIVAGTKNPVPRFVFNLNSFRNRFLRHYLAYRYARKSMLHLRGCNMAFWKEDIYRINGYNEDFESWGHEDLDLAYRLVFAGVRKKALKMGGVAYHLYHPYASRHKEEENWQKVEKQKAQRKFWAADGLDKYTGK